MEDLGALPDAGELLLRLRHLGPPVLLDSGGGPPHGRSSVLALPFGRRLSWRRGDAGDPFALLAERLGAAPRVPGAPEYSGGCVALLSYELRHALEELPGRHQPLSTLPDLLVIESRVTVVRDEQTGLGRLAVLHGGDNDPAQAELLAQRSAVLEALQRPLPPMSSVAPTVLEAPDAAAHEARVRCALEHIRRGDIYQANLAQHWTLARPADLLEHHVALRRLNPPSFGAWLEHEGEALLSFSPEEFLHVQGAAVRTRPIKGTIARGHTTEEDRQRATELRSSTKDRAELAMIVDILRNDLARVCRPGTVRVPSPVDVEVHPTVLHLVAEVTGELRPGLGLVDLLRAAHPGGSITGAPRIRAMEIIDALEAEARGPYCGSLGWIGCDGSSRFNILIRTLYSGGGVLHLHAGGGIVLDSDPAAEREETLQKVAALLGQE